MTVMADEVAAGVRLPGNAWLTVPTLTMEAFFLASLNPQRPFR